MEFTVICWPVPKRSAAKKAHRVSPAYISLICSNLIIDHLLITPTVKRKSFLEIHGLLLASLLLTSRDATTDQETNESFIAVTLFLIHSLSGSVGGVLLH